MRIKIVGIVCLLVLIGAWAYVHAQTTPKLVLAPATSQPVLPTGPNGRYQIVAMDFDPGNLSGNLKHKTAIRIDTQTGHTWQLIELPVQGGGTNLYWESLEEDK